MSVSIIVPIYNEIHAVQRRLTVYRSLLNHGAQLIFVDGGSDDGTVELLQAQGFYCVNALLGRASQMNAGAQVANGDILIFLHADTDIDNALLDEVNRSRFAWGFAHIVLSSSAFIYRIIERGIRFRSLIFNIATGDQVLFFKADFFHSLGGFPPLLLMEDISISRIAKQHSKPARLTCKVVSSSRRWERFGPIKTVIFMWYIQLLFKIGVSTRTLNTMYRSGHWSMNARP